MTKELRDSEQAYFWTKEWQEDEAKADADIRDGRVTRFSNAEDAIEYMKMVPPSFQKMFKAFVRNIDVRL